MSWIIRDKETKTAVVEIFDKRKLKYLNTIKYEAVPAAQHLTEFNEAIKTTNGWPTSLMQMSEAVQKAEIDRLTGRTP